MSFFNRRVPYRDPLYPHVCAVCSLRRRDPGICAHHVEAVAMTQESGEGYAEGWADGNRIFCNWIHRGEIRAAVLVGLLALGLSACGTREVNISELSRAHRKDVMQRLDGTPTLRMPSSGGDHFYRCPYPRTATIRVSDKHVMVACDGFSLWAAR